MSWSFRAEITFFQIKPTASYNEYKFSTSVYEADEILKVLLCIKKLAVHRDLSLRRTIGKHMRVSRLHISGEIQVSRMES